MSGHNHYPDCTCGWCVGGGGYGGGPSYGRPSPVAGPSGPSTWAQADGECCRPTTCPVCGASVFFVRHNGGSVWFDELGAPWQKHACFDDDSIGTGLRELLHTGPGALFGIIVKTERHGRVPRQVRVSVENVPPFRLDDSAKNLVEIRCSDGTTVFQVFDDPVNWRTLLGALVVLSWKGPQLTLRIVSSPAADNLSKYWIVWEIGTDTVVGEFPFSKRAEAEACVRNMQPKFKWRLHVGLAEYVGTSRGSDMSAFPKQ